MIYFHQNELLFWGNHDFLFLLPFMLCNKNTRDLSIFWKTIFRKPCCTQQHKNNFFGTTSLREASRKHQHNSAIKCITEKNVPHKVTA